MLCFDEKIVPIETQTLYANVQVPHLLKALLFDARFQRVYSLQMFSLFSMHTNPSLELESEMVQVVPEPAAVFCRMSK